MNKKILVLLVSSILFCMYTPMAIGDDTASVSGTFTPNTTIDINTNVSVLDYGSLDLNTNTTRYVNVSNEGDTVANVVVQAFDLSNWTIEAWDGDAPTQDTYQIGGLGASGNNGQEFDFVDFESEATVDANLPASGTAGCHSNCEISMILSATTTLDSHEEAFWVNYTASAAT